MDPHEITLDLPGRYEAFCRLWLPDRPKAAVLYIHGIQSHGGWFERSAEHLARAGCAVMLPDRRGSGRNPLDRGHAESPRQLIDDLLVALAGLSARSGRQRVTIVAVSWGGKLALALTRRVPDRLARLVLVAPGLFPQVSIPFAQKWSVAWSSQLWPRRQFDVPLDDPELFTGTDRWLEFLRDDPLSVHRVSARFLLTSRRLDWEVRAYGRRPPAVPLRLFLAGRDRIIHNERTRQFVRDLSVSDRAIIEHPNAHHTLEFEPDPGPYVQDLTSAVMGER
jgi:alpha-beta hydrolase superfamily lysophospholipase